MTSSDRLSRQELSWLLTQEARRAAQTLRKGVVALSQPPAAQPVDPNASPAEIVSSLAALEDAMKALASLNTTMGTRGTRGAHDLAAMVCDLAPQARLRIAPGSGTEVFGDDGELRRMIQIMLSQTGGTHGSRAREAPEVRISREGDEVHMSVPLGPDTLAAGSSEHAWLSRMALRYGGRLLLEGGHRSLILPAQGALDRKELDSLRKELEAAQQQGELYARELAAVFATGEGTPQGASPSAMPSPSTGLAPFAAFAAAVAAQLRPVHQALSREIPASRSVEANLSTDTLHSCSGQVGEVLTDLQRLAKVPLDELPTHLDVSSLLAAIVQDADARASNQGVALTLSIPEHLHAFVCPGAFRALARFLIDHGVAATARAHKVVVHVGCTSQKLRLIVDDDGTAIPASSRDALLQRRVDPGSIGRPGGIHLLAASVIVAHLHGTLEISDSPDLGCRTIAILPLP